MVPVILDRGLLNVVGHSHNISSMSEDRCFSRSLPFILNFVSSENVGSKWYDSISSRYFHFRDI